MGRFDVHNFGASLVVDVQTNLLVGLNTRLVVPLVSTDEAPLPASRLNPVFIVNGEPYALQPQLMAAVPARVLEHALDNLKREEDRIALALSMIFNGF